MKKRGIPSQVIGTITSSVIAASLAGVLASPIAISIFYSGFFASIWAAIFGPSLFYLLLSGTGIGLLVAGPLLLAIISGPAYRKTIPATMNMIIIRKRLEGEGKSQ